MYDFEEGLKSIPATREALDMPWLENISQYGEFIKHLNGDNFYEGSPSISETVEVLHDIGAVIESTEIFYHIYPEKRELLNKIISNMEELRAKKTAMDPALIMRDVDKYNDNLEEAKTGAYRDYLIECCKIYNNSDTRVTSFRYWFKGREYNGYANNGSYTQDVGHYDENGWVTTGGTTTKYPIDEILWEKRDKIKYQQFITTPKTRYLTSNDNLVKALQVRGWKDLKYITRPSETEFSG